jgi:hypothetical protein
MRAILIFASCLLLAGCTYEPWTLPPLLQSDLGKLRADIAANPQTTAFLITFLLGSIAYLSLALARARRRAAKRAERPSFPVWLAYLPKDGAEVEELQKYSQDVRWTGNDITALRRTIENDPIITQAQRVRRASTLGVLYERWQGEGPSSGGSFSTQLMHYVFENGTGIFLSAFAIAVFIMLAVGMTNLSFFSSLAQVDQARGLITFLVAICAVAVILLTAINIFWGDNKAEFEERFKAAKDLVTLVVGVLGTILGFYFGSISGDHLLQLNIEKPTSYQPVVVKSNLAVAATAKNGSGPFNFDLLLLDENGKATKYFENKQSDRPFLSQDVKAPDEPGRYSIIMLVRDSKGQQTKSTVDILVTPTTSAAPAAAQPAAPAAAQPAAPAAPPPATPSTPATPAPAAPTPPPAAPAAAGPAR